MITIFVHYPETGKDVVLCGNHESVWAFYWLLVQSKQECWVTCHNHRGTPLDLRKGVYDNYTDTQLVIKLPSQEEL